MPACSPFVIHVPLYWPISAEVILTSDGLGRHVPTRLRLRWSRHVAAWPAQHGVKASTLSFYYKDFIFSANESPLRVLSEYISYVLGQSVYLDGYPLKRLRWSRTVSPKMVSKLAHSVFIIKTWYLVQMKALDVLYPKKYHMYLAIVYILTAIPKNVLDDPALSRPTRCQY